MGRTPEEHNRIRITGLFHDIGKIKVPDNILLKDGALTFEERAKIQNHPIYAVEIMANVEMFTEMIPGVLQHHERYDGTGYPNRLAGNAICEDARIISVADSFDAMTSFRRYRQNMTTLQAKEEILRNKGTQFDPHIADVFAEMLDEFEEMKNDPAWIDPHIDAALEK